MVVVLLFLTACAYMAAALYEKLNPSVDTVQAETRSITESAQLYGIAIRREQLVCSPDDAAVSAENFKKYSVFESMAVFGSDFSFSAQFFENCDGFEYLSPDSLFPYSSQRFESLMDCEKALPHRYWGKLVTDDVWYFAARISSGQMPQKGSLCTVIFDGTSESCQATVWDSDEDCLLLRLNSGSAELLTLRKCSARLVFGQYEGISVPRSALRRDSEGKFYVCVLSAGLVEKRSVDIIYTGEDFVLSRCLYSEDALREGEMIIVGMVSDEYS